MAATVVEGGPEPCCELCQLRAERGIADPPGGCTCQAPVTVAGRGPESVALALVEAMDGSERTVLLRHIAAARPDVVHGGIAWLAEWRADVAERRRAAQRRREHDRRRRQRAEAGSQG